MALPITYQGKTYDLSNPQQTAAYKSAIGITSATPMAPISAPAPTAPTLPSSSSPVPMASPESTQSLIAAYNANGGKPLTTEQIGSAMGSPTVPTNTASPTPAPGTPTGSSSSTGTDNEILKQLLDSMKVTPEETALQGKINDISGQQAGINASRDLGIQGVNEQPIATPFITGEGAAITNRAAVQSGALGAQLDPLQRQMATMQAKRQASIDAGKAALEYSKPVNLGIGADLVNPLTGEKVASGQSYTQKMGADKIYSLYSQFPDAGIDPNTDTLQSASQKAANSGSFKAKYIGFQIDPFTGEIISTNRYAAGGGTTPSNLGTGGGSTGGSGGSTLGTVGSLDVGSQNASVKSLQSFLISQGYSIPDGATGYYGPQTQAAVAAFQKAAGVDTSGGGVGTFGPRTQAAAAAKGYSLAGTMTGSGGAPSGGGSTSTAGIPAQLQSSVTSVGNIKFIDGSKLTAAQIPYAQRAAQTSHIPYLSGDDASKVKAAYASYSGASSLVSELSSLSKNVLTAKNDPAEMTAQAAKLKFIEKAPYLSTDDNAKEFIKARDALLSLITRAAGEKGTLTDKDVERIQQALPAFTDNAELAAQKAANLSTVLESVFSGSLSGYLGGQTFGSTAASGGAAGSTYKGFTLPN